MRIFATFQNLTILAQYIERNMTLETIGFIGGGQMAKALAGGAIRAGIVKPEQLVVAEPNVAQQEQFIATVGKVQLCDHGHEVLKRL